MRSLKTVCSLLFAVSLLGFTGSSSLLMAGDGDPPHQAHLAASTGPSTFFLVEGLAAGEECLRCHTGAPAWNNVDTNRCATCHTTGGVYDGVSDSTVGALNNWQNRGSSDAATESLVYDGTGALKDGKEKWCAGCHDQTETGTAARGTPIDDFESGLNNWGSGGDIAGATIEPFWDDANPVQGIRGNFLSLTLQWQKTGQPYGQISKDLTGNPQDFSDRDSFNFYMLMQDARQIQGIKIGLQINGQYSQSTCYFNFNNDPSPNIKINGFEDNTWKLVSLPRAAFGGPTWDSGLVDKIVIQFYEEASGGNYTKYFCIDEFGCDITGQNIAGDVSQTYGYYVTGHRMSCNQCHDVTSAHIDGNTLQPLEYITNEENPTNFRLYTGDPSNQIRIPYNNDNTDVYATEDFSMCYRCHFEDNLVGDAWGGNTNFKDESAVTCQLPPNLHYLHVVEFVSDPWPATCIHCHDVHGQVNPAMTREEMGDSIAFGPAGCELEVGVDSDGDDIDDRYEPDLNMGLALQGRTGNILVSPGLCEDCHESGPAYLTPPNTPPCDPADNPFQDQFSACLSDGWYSRTYERRPHTGDPDSSCIAPGCHGGGSHDTHVAGDPKGPDPLDCEDCHAGVIPDLVPGACDQCHSPGGAFDGVQMALANWDNIYESDGVTLQAGKEQWCATCHDDGVAFSYPIIVDDVIVDNADTPDKFSVTCNWGTGTGGGYGGNVRYHQVASTGGCEATWAPDLPMSGEYNVYARWTSYWNRAHAAPYTITYNGGADAETISVDQRVDGGLWILLGTYYFAADGTESVVLSADNAVGDAGDYVIADAVRFENLEYQGAYAPNVAGDNITYGYYVNGHKFACTVCHDAGSEHIDHNQRSYTVDESTCDPGPCVVVTSYEDGYRLSDVLGERPMVIPKESTDLNPSEFALCARCHDPDPLLAPTPGDPAVTNFYRDTDPYNRNFHQYHLNMEALLWDSDWDAVIGGTPLASVDSMPSCGACHNVHGSPSATMTRHGELISSPGTSDKVPALDFCYAETVGGRECNLTEPYPDSIGGSMYFLGYPERGSFVCVDCHGGYAFYYRDPVDIPTPAAPIVSDASASPATITNDGAIEVLFTARVHDPNIDPVSVEVDLSALGGGATQPMYDDGTNGDVAADDGIYSYLFPGTTAATGNYVVTISGSDPSSNTGTGEAKVIVHDEYGSIIVDNLEANFACEWTVSTGNPGPGTFFGFDTQYRATVGQGCSASWDFCTANTGDYNVYARWTSYYNRVDSAPYTIFYDGGSEVVPVNQQLNGGDWVLLGTYPFAASTPGSVELTDNGSGGNVTIADAIKVEPVP